MTALVPPCCSSLSANFELKGAREHRLFYRRRVLRTPSVVFVCVPTLGSSGLQRPTASSPASSRRSGRLLVLILPVHPTFRQQPPIKKILHEISYFEVSRQHARCYSYLRDWRLISPRCPLPFRVPCPPSQGNLRGWSPREITIHVQAQLGSPIG